MVYIILILYIARMLTVLCARATIEVKNWSVTPACSSNVALHIHTILTLLPSAPLLYYATTGDLIKFFSNLKINRPPPTLHVYFTSL